VVYELTNDSPRHQAAWIMRLLAEVPTLTRGKVEPKPEMVPGHGLNNLLDLLAILAEGRNFFPAALGFCNRLANLLACEKVSLGWLDGEQVVVRNISHMERFDSRTTVVEAMVRVMEESLDQDIDIRWPNPPEQHAICRDHEGYTRDHAAVNLLTMPVRRYDQPVGVLLCERRHPPFSHQEVDYLRVLLDLAVPVLDSLDREEQPFFQQVQSLLHRRVLPSTPAGKRSLTGRMFILASVCLLLSVEWWPYRIDAPFMLKTDDLWVAAAPQDGFIEEVRVKVGDEVKTGEVLISLDRRTLELDEAEALAEVMQHTREAEKAGAAHSLADMRIALASRDQKQAILERVRYQLAGTQVKAPFDGVVVEGDMQKLLGAPVHKGDPLFRLAKRERLYVDLEVDERDIHLVEQGAHGAIAFLARPQLDYAIVVARIEPAAEAKEGGNIIRVRAQLKDSFADWWRPGMTGVGKIQVGLRSPLWVMLRRSLDTLRLKLWW
ncbi:MAG: efflux RND transporter periplasmic adaptor subunit, partial [Magnetococcales bacterium]|nr:efflux RND transporter periplasmic adaptor subunit [Magnetococcales bacterium]